ncbi:hypothetical protein CVT24_010900 [Panaeolus cyanescens]|uniref:HlyIII-domain-containing protein n=1 Tax=Panaeolus cyanescens TaxID=181874 RepID=A0A409WAQ9_9AGAR|nr:hypothetical protein CVT24_010900 [Panaeolus cyanescens]
MAVQKLKNRKAAQSQRSAKSHDVTAAASSRYSKRKTLTWDELEDWQKDNEYIITGYRPLQHNWKGCLTSVIAYLHNETVNIHSHLWASAFFLYSLFTVYPTYIHHHDHTSWVDVVILGVFLLSATLCLAASAFYHTSCCHSKEVRKLHGFIFRELILPESSQLQVSTRCHAFDYSGIIVLIVGSFFPSIYYGFWCQPSFQVLYLGAMMVAGLGLSMHVAGAAYLVLDPEYAKPTHRGARTSVFIALGLGAIVPTTHMFMVHDFNELVTEMGVNWLLASGALYIIGALL